MDRQKSGEKVGGLVLGQDPEGLRFDNRLTATVDLKLGVDSDRVLAHRAGSNEQLRTDLFVGEALGQQGQHFVLALGQGLDQPMGFRLDSVRGWRRGGSCCRRLLAICSWPECGQNPAHIEGAIASLGLTFKKLEFHNFSHFSSL